MMTWSLFVVVYLCWMSMASVETSRAKRRWFLSQDLPCRFCDKKSKRFDLLPDRKETRPVKVMFVSKQPKCELSERFLSFSLDTLELKRRLRCFPLNSTKLNTLVSALAPAYFRVGGTPQDFLHFTTDAGNETVTNASCVPFFENWARMKQFDYSLTEFDKLYNFADRNGLRLIFGLNALLRNRDGSWKYQNIPKELFTKYAGKVDWEIGNEPNRFNKYGPSAEVKPEQLARDLKQLRQLLKPAKARIYGPDVTKPSVKALQYLKTFLESSPQVDAVTYHMYEMQQATATLKDFVNPLYLMRLEEEMSWITKIVRDANTLSSTADIWIGETGSASGGGAPGLSDKFVSGFLYLGKLGLASEMCHKVVVRQSLYGGYYGMLDPVTHDPLPDYWTSVLFKRLVRNVVLTSSGSGDPFLRTHFYCSNRAKEDVVISLVNMRLESTYELLIQQYEDKFIEMFLFTNPDSLQSNSTYLNGKRLAMESDKRLPKVSGRVVRQPVHIPSQSYGFLVLRNVKAKACL